MAKKSYFNERTPKEIRNLRVNTTYGQKDLVQIIEELDSSTDFLEIRTHLIPGDFRRGNISGAEASRKFYKHGNLITLPQPRTLKDALESKYIPMDLRIEAFKKLAGMKQEEINFIGYSWRPVFGRDRTKRVVPFVWLPEGARIFSYAENNSLFRQKNPNTGIVETKKGIKVQEYADSKRVRTEGASVVLEVPSRTKKAPHYIFGLNHVPYIPNLPGLEENTNLASIFSLNHASIKGEDFEYIQGHTPHDIFDIRYTFENSREQSPLIKFSAQDIAGYLGIIKKQLTQQHNSTTLTFNPFALPSRHQAEFYNKLNNNVVIYDPTLSSKTKLRKLHIAEKSILLGRAIAHFGHDDFAYWDPTRDGIFKGYDWSMENKKIKTQQGL